MRDAKKTEDEGVTVVNELPMAKSLPTKKDTTILDTSLVSNEGTRGETQSRKSEKYPTDTNSGHSNIDLNEKAKQAFLSGRKGKKKKKVKAEDQNPEIFPKKKTPDRKKASCSNSDQIIICVDSDPEDMIL